MMTSSIGRVETPDLAAHGDAPVRVLPMIGSTRDDRFGPVPAAWAAERAQERGGIDLDVVDLAESKLPVVLPGNSEHVPLPDAAAHLGRRIESADAVVIVTPVYNRGYPAPLKNAIDWFHTEWAATPVGFVLTGDAPAVSRLWNNCVACLSNSAR